jgi:hypothetical protein
MSWADIDQAADGWEGFGCLTITSTAKLETMPAEVIARIASEVLEVPLAVIQEVRACNCLGPVSKPFPYRAGQIQYVIDQYTKDKIRQDCEKCSLDARSGLGSWCLKQRLARAPGKKRLIPAFAMASKILYKKWRDATAWVFCSETCMSVLIRGLPKYNKHLVTRARFYERNNDRNIDGLAHESFFANTVGGWDDYLLYETDGNKRVKYRNQEVWVKELILPGNDI